MNLSSYLAGADWETLLSQPVAVPPDLLMLHSGNWPVVTTAPAPKFAITAGRTHDSAIGGWRGIEKTPGVYDWSAMDAFAGTFSSVCLTIYSTPAFYATSQAPDHYGNPGASSPPKDLSKLQAFVQAACARYGSKVFVECWNEPDGGFFTGTMPQLADMCATIKSAAKAGNGCRVLSPAFVHPQDTLAAFMSAKGPATGQYGRDTFDELAIHNYGSLPFPLNGCDDLAWSGMGGIVRSQRLLETMGFASRPINMTEFGFGTANSTQLAAFKALSPWQRRQRMAGSIITAAALGVRTFGLYSYNSGLCGDLVADTAGVIAGIQDAQAFLAPGAILSLKHHHSGAARAVNNAGTVYSWNQ